MSYIDNTLIRDERVIYRGHVHWVIFAPCIFFTCAALGSFYLLGGNFIGEMVGGFLLFYSAFSFLRALIYFFSTEFGVTDQRVLVKFGFIRRTTFELNVDRIMSLNINQTVLGRIFNYGDVFVNGIGGIATPIPMVSDPLTFRKNVLQEV